MILSTFVIKHFHQPFLGVLLLEVIFGVNNIYIHTLQKETPLKSYETALYTYVQMTLFLNQFAYVMKRVICINDLLKID